MAKLPAIEQALINSSSNEFIQTFETTLQMHAPLRNITRKERKQKQKPWITNGILISIK